MKINKVYIRNLVTFQFAQITELTMTLTDIIQLILGTNGSGKSNLLRQLSPLPPSRPDFLEGGCKRLEIEHGGQEFIIVSDFSRKDSPHEFWLNGRNLNEGGTTDVQKELVIRHLGWTPEVEALCFNSYNFTGLSTGQREALFTKLNPYKIDFILDHSKKAKSRIRACKAVIAKLLERKVLLESKLMPDDMRILLTNEREQLQRESSDLSKILVKIETHLGNLKQQDKPQSTELILEQVPKVIKEIRSICDQWTDVSREDPEAQLEQTLHKKATHKANIDSTLTDLEDLQSSLRTGKATLSDMVGEEMIDWLRCEIVSLHSKIDELEKFADDHPFPKNIVEEKPEILSRTRKILDFFADNPAHLLSRKKMALKEKFLSYWGSYYGELRRLARNADIKLGQLRDSLKLKMDDIPDNPCAKSQCPLYVNFKSTYDTTQSLIKNELAHRDSVLRRQKRVQRYLEHQENQLAQLVQHNTMLNELYHLITTYPAIQQFFKDPNILGILEHNPISIYHKLDTAFKKSESYYELIPLREKVLKAEVELAKHQSISGNEKSALTKRIREIEQTIEKKERALAKHRIAYNQQIVLESYIRQYTGWMNRLDNLPQYIEDYVGMKSLEKEITKLQMLDHDIQEEYRKRNNRLSEIQSTLRDQDILQSRYQNEVLAVIEDTEIEKAKLEVLNEAFEALPQSYTSQYLNCIIKSANAFISKVFTYELRILPVSPDKTVTYRFPYQAGGTEGPDISKCSTAQSEIINLALTMACRQALMLNDYPLFLDEVGKTFDPTHQQKLLDLFLFICDEHLATQLFIVNHHAVIHGGLMNTETLVLNDTNIMKTENYNQHVVMETY